MLKGIESSNLSISAMRNTEEAFLWIINILEDKEIKYKISGGFSARLYGVERELADIDIEIIDEDFSKILNEIKDYIIFGPDRYKDAHWDLNLITLNYEGQEIDLASVQAKIFNNNTKLWELKNTIENWMDSDNFEIKEVFGKKVLIESIKSLKEYKVKLSRDVDLEDLKQLNKIF